MSGAGENNMPHPDEGLIHAWLDGELDAAEAARVEALVQSDAEWGAAAAEARGLLAASSRIVGALDRVPANVIPQAQPVRRAGRQWMWRAAAALVLVAGSAVVLQKESPESPESTMLQVAPPAAKEQTAELAKKVTEPSPAPAKSKSDSPQKELDAVKKQNEISRDKDVAALADANATANAAAAGSINRLATPAAPPTAAGGAAPARIAAQRAAADKAEAKVAAIVSCFEQRVPTDSAKRIIRLGAAALDDSIRLERLALRGDTLAAVHSRLIAVRVPCP